VNSEINQSEEMMEQAENGPIAELSLEEVQQKLEEEQKKSADYLDRVKRVQADFQNLKRRTENERASLNIEARERLLVKVLPIVDDFERALQSLPEGLKGEPWINGVSLIERKLKVLLDQEGVSEIPANDAEFDPRLHEAVDHDPESAGEKDYVSAVYQKGYRMGEKIIRPAIVKVGRR